MLVGGDSGGLNASSSSLKSLSTDLAGAAGDLKGINPGSIENGELAAAVETFIAASAGLTTADSLGVGTLGKAASTQADLLDKIG